MCLRPNYIIFWVVNQKKKLHLFYRMIPLHSTFLYKSKPLHCIKDSIFLAHCVSRVWHKRSCSTNIAKFLFKIVLTFLFLALLFFLVISKIMSKRKAPVITYENAVQNILTLCWEWCHRRWIRSSFRKPKWWWWTWNWRERCRRKSDRR